MTSSRRQLCRLSASQTADVLRVRARAAPTPATVPIPSPVRPPAAAASPRGERKPRQASNNTGDVIAAFVEGAVAAGMDRPPEDIRKRVGSAAVRLLGEGYTLDRLVASARAMGATTYNDLAIQVRKDDPKADNGQPKGHKTFTNADPADFDARYGQ